MHIENDGHSHRHEHIHEHPHEHPHGHNHACHNEELGQKDLALLKYMLEHNRQHARELVQSGEMLKNAGHHAAAELVFDAIHYFEHGNDKLESAIESLTGN